MSFGGIDLISMEDCAPFAFLGSWALMVSYLCFRFCISNRPILEEYVFEVEGTHTYFNHTYMHRKMVSFYN
jgi:hypothetical protein